MPDVPADPTATVIPAADPAPAPGGTTPAPAPAADPAPAPAEPAPAAKADDELQQLRDQLAQEQVKAAQRAKDAAKAAEDAVMKKIGLAAGFIEDDTKAPDAEALAKQAAESAKVAKATRIENAVIREAPKHGGDIDALLDSTAFTKALDKLDPASDGFREQVADLIKSTVAANPKYAAAPIVPGRSGGDPNAGSGEGTGQITREQLDRMSPQERLKAHKEGRLKHLLGG